MSKVALVTGITGQDGSYLAELLLAKGYQVHGVMRRSSTFTTDRIEHLYHDVHEPGPKLELHYGDVLDPLGLRQIISDIKPDEVYNLAAQSHVRTSFDTPVYTAEVVAIGALNLLEAVRDFRDATGREVRVYQAGSSEMFGNALELPQNEKTPFRPRSPYACAKVHAFWQAVNHREAYDLHVCNGILFNHESPRRGETFVTRKITRAAARISLGLQSRLFLGNLEAKRDWGFAGDYVEAMWLMLQRGVADDYVVATGESHSVEEFLDEAFACVELNWRDFVKTDAKYLRPTEVHELRGDAGKARAELPWRPEVGFKKLVRMMVESDLLAAKKEAAGVEVDKLEAIAG